MIFFRKDPVLGVDLEYAINNAVFPGLQVLQPLLFLMLESILMLPEFTWFVENLLFILSILSSTMDLCYAGWASQSHDWWACSMSKVRTVTRV